MGDSLAVIGVNGPACHIGASNTIPGILPRSWGSRSYEMEQMEHGRLLGQQSLVVRQELRGAGAFRTACSKRRVATSVKTLMRHAALYDSAAALTKLYAGLNRLFMAGQSDGLEAVIQSIQRQGNGHLDES